MKKGWKPTTAEKLQYAGMLDECFEIIEPTTSLDEVEATFVQCARQASAQNRQSGNIRYQDSPEIKKLCDMRRRSSSKQFKLETSRRIHQLRYSTKAAYHEWKCEQVANLNWLHSQNMLRELQSDRNHNMSTILLDQDKVEHEVCDTEACNVAEILGQCVC